MHKYTPFHTIMPVSCNLCRYLTKSSETPLHKGVSVSEVSSRYLTQTSPKPHFRPHLFPLPSSLFPLPSSFFPLPSKWGTSEVQVRYLRETSPLKTPLYKGISRDLVRYLPFSDQRAQISPHCSVAVRIYIYWLLGWWREMSHSSFTYFRFFSIFLSKSLGSFIFYSYLCSRLGKPERVNGSRIFGKGRLRTLSSTHESRTFSLRRYATETSA